MRPTFNIRPALVEEATPLSDLCFRSKAVWGYDAGFMTLMPAALEVAPKEIAAGDVWITTGTDGQIAGVVALAPGEGRWPINPGLKQTKRDAIQSLAAPANRHRQGHQAGSGSRHRLTWK